MSECPASDRIASDPVNTPITPLATVSAAEAAIEVSATCSFSLCIWERLAGRNETWKPVKGRREIWRKPGISQPRRLYVVAAAGLRAKIECRVSYQTSRCGICEQICCIKVGNWAAVGVFSAVPLPRINVASQAASLLLVP